MNAEAAPIVPSLATAIDLQIVRLGQPGASTILRGENKPFEEVDDYVRAMAWSMAKTMYSEPGVGLAAPQIGANVRLIVVDPFWAADASMPQKPIFMLNPNITRKSEETSMGMEACLSVPGLELKVSRSDEIEVTYINLDGEEQTAVSEGWEARIIQHEVDHLEGILLLDYLSRLRRDIYTRKLNKHARRIKRAFKEAQTNARDSRIQARRMERPSCGHVSEEPMSDIDVNGGTSYGSGPGTPNYGLEFNQPEGS